MKYIFWINWIALTWLILYGKTPANNQIGTAVVWIGFLILAILASLPTRSKEILDDKEE